MIAIRSDSGTFPAKTQSTNFFTKLNLGGGGPWEPMFPDGPVIKNLPVNAGNMGLIPIWATKLCVSQEKALQ